MSRTISIADELRALRNGGKAAVVREPDEEKSETPALQEIDRMQQELRDLVKSVSRLSGVELADGPGGPQSPDGSAPQLEFNTLKDRIRKDLEAFSVSTTSELTKQAEEKARATLSAFQSEAQEQIELVVGQLRKKLQGQLIPEQIEVGIAQQTRDHIAELVKSRTDEFAQWVWLVCQGTDTPIPVQLEKMLEPCVDEAIARTRESSQHRVEALFTEQDSLVQERLQNSLSSFQAQISDLEQASLQSYERNADVVAKQSADRLNAEADEAVKNFQGRTGGEIEASVGLFQSRLQEAATRAQDELHRQEDLQSEGFSRRLEELAGAVKDQHLIEVTGRIEKTAGHIIASSVEHLHEQAADATDHSKQELAAFLKLQMEGVQQQVAELGRSVHDSISQGAERVAAFLDSLDQEIGATRDKHLAASEEQLSAMLERTLGTLATSIQQLADARLEEMTRRMCDSQNKATSQFESRLQGVLEERYQQMLERFQKDSGEASSRVAEEVRANSESVVQELSNKLNASASAVKEEAAQAASQMEELMKSSLDNYRQQLAQIAGNGLEQQRNSISGNIADLRTRLKQAADLLGTSNL